MNIYIAGAGAMGCRFGVQLQDSGQKVVLLDTWQDHIDSIQTNGLKVTGDQERVVQIPIMNPQEASEKAELIILFTKAMQLKKMMEATRHLIDDETKVLCLLNGLGHEDILKDYVAIDNIMMGVTIWTAELKGPGHVHLIGTGTINLQSLSESGQNFGEQVVSLLNNARLSAEYDQDIIPSIWRKACVNGTMNSTCALLDCRIGEFFASDHGINLVKNLIKEFVEVAHLEKISLDYDEMVDYVFETSKKAKDHYPSMHQDLVQNKRKTEIDVINGAIVSKGHKYHHPTPFNQEIVDLIHAKESIVGAN